MPPASFRSSLQPSPLESNLRHLTDEVGGRVPGTPAMQRAIDWGVQMFKDAGADSVHTEEFTIPYSWSEGATEMTVSATGTALDPKLTNSSQGRVPRALRFHHVGARARFREARAGGRCRQRQSCRLRKSRRHFRQNRTRPFGRAQDLGAISSPSIRTRPQ